MPDGNNRVRPFAVIVSVLSAIIVAMLSVIMAVALNTHGDLGDHQSSGDPHPVITQAVNATSKRIERMSTNVDEMMKRQERQTAILEGMSQDIDDLKHAPR